MDRKPIFLPIPTQVAELIAINRHVLCPHYDECLDEAVLKNLHFDCSGCLFMMLDIKSFAAA